MALFACRRCGTCYEDHHMIDEMPAWCPYCVIEYPDPVFDDLRDRDVVGAVGTLAINFSREARRAKRLRMATRRGWKAPSLQGPPILASNAYRGGWVEGFLLYEDLLKSGF